MLGLTSLFDEMGLQGHSISDVLSGTNISPDAMNQSSLYVSQVQKIQLFQNIQKLSHDPLIRLRAGQKQPLSDFRVYGYALYSSRNFRQAVELSIRHFKLAGNGMGASGKKGGMLGKEWAPPNPNARILEMLKR